MNITEFLNARITEDEAAAHAATPGPWEWVGDPANDQAFLCTENGSAVISSYGNHTEGYIECSEPNRTYIARSNPTRALADCAAKRAIIADHAEFVKAIDTLSSALPGELNQDPQAPWRTSILKHLASVYKAHPDYQQEWAIGG